MKRRVNEEPIYFIGNDMTANIAVQVLQHFTNKVIFRTFLPEKKSQFGL